jgi:hypothetical protein
MPTDALGTNDLAFRLGCPMSPGQRRHRRRYDPAPSPVLPPEAAPEPDRRTELAAVHPAPAHGELGDSDQQVEREQDPAADENRSPAAFDPLDEHQPGQRVDDDARGL